LCELFRKNTAKSVMLMLSFIFAFDQKHSHDCILRKRLA
jgi:hypothetical protein